MLQDYNYNFNIIIDNDTIINCSIPSGKINAFTIRENNNNPSTLKLKMIFMLYMMNLKVRLIFKNQ